MKRQKRKVNKQKAYSNQTHEAEKPTCINTLLIEIY